jgi:hypothetical protein
MTGFFSSQYIPLQSSDQLFRVFGILLFSPPFQQCGLALLIRSINELTIG